MSKHTIGDAVRMTGHLLEHNGITGPFHADSNGNNTAVDDPNTCRYCMSGAFESVARALGLQHSDPFGFKLSEPIENEHGGMNRVVIWEGSNERPTTPEQRLAIARKLQAYNG